jgi:DNA-directed RNA polymerases I, II, and III subunit RPABC1
MSIQNTEYLIKNSFKILKEMLEDRKIDISNLHSINDKELVELHNDNQIFDIKVNDELKVIYYMANKIKIQNIKLFIDEENDKNIIFISKEKLTTNNYKSFSDFKDKNINFQFFFIKELLFNIYKHEYVPKHEVITDKKEIEEIKTKYLLKNLYQLPILLSNDPICKYLDIKSTSVVKITRPSPTAGEYILYRYVV